MNGYIYAILIIFTAIWFIIVYKCATMCCPAKAACSILKLCGKIKQFGLFIWKKHLELRNRARYMIKGDGSTSKI